MSGAIAFGTPEHLEVGERAIENHAFEMFSNREAAFKPIREKYQTLLYFNGSVRGLKIGAPVEFRGIKIGEVLDLHLQISASDFSIRIPVLIEMELGHFEMLGDVEGVARSNNQTRTKMAHMQRLVDNGMRAQLKTGSLITGALYVDFDLHEGVPAEQIVKEDGVLVLPTVPSTLDALTSGVTKILNKIAAMPLEQIGVDLEGAVKKARELLESEEIGSAIHSLSSTLKQTEKFTKNVNSMITPQLNATLRELKDASRSIKAMADYLERHPEALISGKKGGR
ncbi:MAG: MCE family protein [Desulfobulbaceae bacterium]|nr:MCE family protein [Desulfobulbaceae bacterium]